MCVELQRVNFDPKNQSWSFWSHNHETSMKMWKRALIFGRELALVTWTSTPKNESWSFWSHKHETSIKMWKRALIFGRERALVTWINTKQASKCIATCVELPRNKLLFAVEVCVEEVDLTNDWIDQQVTVYTILHPLPLVYNILHCSTFCTYTRCI